MGVSEAAPNTYRRFGHRVRQDAANPAPLGKGMGGGGIAPKKLIRTATPAHQNAGLLPTGRESQLVVSSASGQPRDQSIHKLCWYLPAPCQGPIQTDGVGDRGAGMS